MAISDIPEYIEVIAGDLIRAEDINNLQRQTRNSLRTHQHTRATTAPANDGATVDEALQIDTNEIADLAVTNAKLAGAAVTSDKLAANAVSTTALQNGSVKSSKIAFTTLKSGSATVSPGEMEEQLVVDNAKSTAVYLPIIDVQTTSGTGQSVVQAEIVHRQLVGSTTQDVHIRFKNIGNATANVTWQVVTFTP